jgi:uncharacterized membrane protein YphA (DoxX/SURF4 family)
MTGLNQVGQSRLNKLAEVFNLARVMKEKAAAGRPMPWLLTDILTLLAVASILFGKKARFFAAGRSGRTTSCLPPGLTVVAPSNQETGRSG